MVWQDSLEVLPGDTHHLHCLWWALSTARCTHLKMSTICKIRREKRAELFVSYLIFIFVICGHFFFCCTTAKRKKLKKKTTTHSQAQHPAHPCIKKQSFPLIQPELLFHTFISKQSKHKKYCVKHNCFFVSKTFFLSHLVKYHPLLPHTTSVMIKCIFYKM